MNITDAIAAAKASLEKLRDAAETLTKELQDTEEYKEDERYFLIYYKNRTEDQLGHNQYCKIVQDYEEATGYRIPKSLRKEYKK